MQALICQVVLFVALLPFFARGDNWATISLWVARPSEEPLMSALDADFQPPMYPRVPGLCAKSEIIGRVVKWVFVDVMHY
jgi:hypothetical protein